MESEKIRNMQGNSIDLIRVLIQLDEIRIWNSFPDLLQISTTHTASCCWITKQVKLGFYLDRSALVNIAQLHVFLSMVIFRKLMNRIVKKVHTKKTVAVSGYKVFKWWSIPIRAVAYFCPWPIFEPRYVNPGDVLTYPNWLYPFLD